MKKAPKYKTGRLLVQLGNAVTWFRNQKMQSVGLTSSQFEVIRFFLRRKNAPATAGALMEQLGLSQSTVAGIIKRLEKKSLLERETDDADARKSNLLLTQEGLRLEQTAKNVAVQTEEVLLQGMTDAEQAEFNRLLQIALDNMQAFRLSAARDAEEAGVQKRG